MSTTETPDRSRDAEADVPDEDASTDGYGAPETDEEREPVEVTHAPPRMSQMIAVVAALIGALFTAPFATLAIPFGIAGFGIIAAGLFYTYSRAWVTIGTALVLFGAVITGAYGALSLELMLVGVGSVIIAWDTGQNGIVIGEQIGRETRSRRLQISHAATSAIAIGLVSSVAYAVSLFAGDGRHAAGVATAVLGIVLMAWVLRS